MKKKYVLCICSIFVILIVSFLLVFFTKHIKEEQPTNIRVVSSLEEQIQSLDSFRLDKIVIDIQYGSVHHQNLVVTKEMLSKEDLNQLQTIGLHKVRLNYLGLSLYTHIMLYDEAFLQNQYIYYYADEIESKIFTAKNIFDAEIPFKKGYYFCGWYDSKIKENLYVDQEKRIARLYPMWSKKVVHKVDFYLYNKVIKRLYVGEGELIEYPIVNEENFYCWDHNDLVIKEDIDIYGIISSKNQVVVRFFSKQRELLEYRVISIGESIDDFPKPALDGYVFYAWNQNLQNIQKSLDCYPIYYIEGQRFQVKFYNMDGQLLDTQTIAYGQAAHYEEENDLYYISGFSKNIDSITCDMAVQVYYTPYIFSYYDENQLYAIGFSTQPQPEIPYKEGYTGHWVLKENSKDSFYLQYSKNEDFSSRGGL